MKDLSNLKAFGAAGEEESYLIVIGATTAAEFRAAAALAGLIRAHGHVEGNEHDEPMQAYVVQREMEDQTMAWDCEADANTPGAQAGMVATMYWAEAHETEKTIDAGAQAVEALALSLNRVLHSDVHGEFISSLKKLQST